MSADIIESYQVVAEHERVVQLDDVSTHVTHIKIKKDLRKDGEFWPVWQHTYDSYCDTGSYLNIDAAIKYWENKLTSITPKVKVEENSSYF